MGDLVACRDSYIFPLFILFTGWKNKINKGEEEGSTEGY
jgi:hypothetical protein